MTPEDTELVAALELVVSREEGSALVLSNARSLSGELAEALAARATASMAAGEKELGEDFSAWAAESRALVTRRLANANRSEEAGAEFLQNHRGRFDEGFFDLCFRIAEEACRRARATIEAAADPTPAAGAVEEALEDASREATIMAGIAGFVGDARNRAKAVLLKGTLLLHRSLWESRQGHKPVADQAAAEAGQALRSAAACPVLPAEFRALAEMRLAALAGPSDPEAIIRHQEAALALALAGKAWDIVRTIRRDRAYWAKERGDLRAALQLYRENIAMSERGFFTARVPGEAVDLQVKTQEDYEGAVDACLELAKSDPSFYEQALENAEQGKARAFLRGLATVGTALGPVPHGLEERRKRILERMSDLAANEAEKAALLNRALRTVEDQIWRHSRIVALDMQCVPCAAKEMRALVPPGGVILSYFTFSDRLVVFVLDENGLVAPPTDIRVDYDLLARWTVEFEMVIRNRGHYETTEAVQRKMDMQIPALNAAPYLRKFHEVLLQPVAGQLAGKRLVTVVPHRILSRLPFAAMVDSGNRALVDDFPIIHSISLSVLRWCQAHPLTALQTCFAAGVCELAGGPKGAEDEAASVARVFGCAPSPATCDAFRQEAGNRDVIHLACHSDTTPVSTAFVGLQLEDGLLMQRAIAGLPCHAALVTMSACTTARSDLLGRQGTEFAGMIGAFFRAGCPSVIGSLWPVADAVAVPFAEALYAALKRGGLNKAEALQRAQLAIKARAEDGYDHPYFWAPFGLWGNP